MINYIQIVFKSYRKAGLILAPILFLCVFLTPLSAQTALRVEAMLEEKTLSWSEAAVFALEAADLEAFVDPVDAFQYALDRKWLPKKALPGDPARLNGISLLLMRAFELKGGFFYTIAKNPHYAYRELVYKEVIQGRTDPGMTVSGPDFLFIIGRILSIVEETDFFTPLGDRPAGAVPVDPEKLAEQEAFAEELNERLSSLPDTRARVTSEGVTISLSNIQFLANSAVLADSEKAKLLEISGILENLSDRRILVTGHTALAGTRTDRQQTSLERARAVADYLVSLDARRADKISVYGHGADRPIADNRTTQGMAMNRRVEITIVDY